ncbi:FMR1 neighbor protein isoform X2 [Tamandua tetradactyla]|uniref:FMR1 neighbor protein isoform X2 n=1 Tax=Tamandua tetradactyla TaxID=48850 RepID=UPI004054562D
MPSQGRPARGRYRVSTETMWGRRSRLIIVDTGFPEEIPAMGSHPGVNRFGREVFVATMPQPDGQASLGNLGPERRHSQFTRWAHGPFGLLVITTWVFLLLCFYLNGGFSDSLSANDYIQWIDEHADGQSPEKVTVFGTLLRFFSPTTCIIKENQVVNLCNMQRNMNVSLCLKFKCCYSSSGTSNFSCFVPLEDKPTQMFRMFGLSVFSMIILGCLPMYCCSLFQRRWANPLRRKITRMLKGLKKQRKKRKRNAEMLKRVMKGEEALEGEEKGAGGQSPVFPLR